MAAQAAGVQQEIREATRSWITPLARVGYCTKGAVYLLIGGLALFAALGEGGHVGGPQAAVRTLGEQPFGEALLIAAGVGLAAYALFCLLRAILNLDRGQGMKGVAKRVAAVINTVVYSALSLTAFQLALHEPVGEGGTRTWVARAMNEPFGQVVVGVIGVVVAVHGLLQIRSAVTRRFLRELDQSAMSGRARSVITTIGRVGLCARGLAFGVVGYFLVRAAAMGSPGQSRDLGGALREIASQSHGQVLLGCMAVGLIAYGFYMLASARYARLPT